MRETARERARLPPALARARNRPPRRPWVIVSLHAPWYNSNTAHQGDGEIMRASFEPLFVEAKVDAIFTGHVHS